MVAGPLKTQMLGASPPAIRLDTIQPGYPFVDIGLQMVLRAIDRAPPGEPGTQRNGNCYSLMNSFINFELNKVYD